MACGAAGGFCRTKKSFFPVRRFKPRGSCYNCVLNGADAELPAVRMAQRNMAYGMKRDGPRNRLVWCKYANNELIS